MDRILQSHFDASTKQSLSELFDTALQRAIERRTRVVSRTVLEDTIANALVDLASVGQRNPEQLLRYAEYRAAIAA